MTQGLKITTREGWGIEALKDGSDTAQLFVREPNGDAHALELEGIVVDKDVLKATVGILWFTASVTAQLDYSTLEVDVEHSWLADGPHRFNLNQADEESVRNFIRSYQG